MQRHGVAEPLTVRQIHEGQRLLGQAVVLPGGHDAHHLPLLAPRAHRLPHGALAGPEPPGEPFVHDEHGAPVLVIPLRERAAVQHRDAHGFEVAHVDDVVVDGHALALGRLVAGNGDAVLVTAHPQGHHVGEGGGPDTRQGPDPFQHGVVDGPRAGRLIPLEPRIHGGQGQVVALEALVQRGGPAEAAQEEAGTDQEQE